MYGILQRENDSNAAAGHPELVAAVCGAMRRIAVNDDTCTEFADLGGLAATMQVKITYFPPTMHCWELSSVDAWNVGPVARVPDWNTSVWRCKCAKEVLSVGVCQVC